MTGHSEYTPPTDPIRVIHECERYVIVEKPTGLLSVPGRGEHKHDSLRTRVQDMFPHATGPMTPHRLDMDTSGVMVLALDPKTHASISTQFMHRKTKKNYVAVLDGEVADDEGVIELPLCVDWPNRPLHKVDHEQGKPGKTYFRVTQREPGRTRVVFRPITGRTHQLRIHAAHPRAEGGLGASIVGDPLYGRPNLAPRMLLHASLLCFWAPGTGEWVRYECEPPF